MFSFSQTALSILIIGIIIVAIIFIIKPQSPYNYDYCSICDSYFCEEKLLNYQDPGYSPGIHSALRIIWEQANYGKAINLDWMEEIRLKYNITDCKSFTRINLSNPCPHSPKYKWMTTGYISDVKTSRDVGYPYLVYINPVINNVTYYWKMCEIPAYLSIEEHYPEWLNFSHKYYVFKQKHNAWHHTHKDAHIIDATLNPNYADTINTSWENWRNAYNQYLENGGVDIGDDYWM